MNAKYVQHHLHSKSVLSYNNQFFELYYGNDLMSIELSFKIYEESLYGIYNILLTDPAFL